MAAHWDKLKMIIHSKKSGRISLTIRNTETGETRFYEKENLVTDQGLAQMANSNGYMNRCFLGTGSSTPSPSDTSLDQQYASVVQGNNWPSVSHNVYPSQPLYHNSDVLDPIAWSVMEYRFPKGAAQGNLSEIGIGWGADNVFCRVLVTDGNGNPTTITILDIEELTVHYTARNHIPTDTWIQENVTLGGAKGWTGNVTCKAAWALRHQSWWDSSSNTGALVSYSESHVGGRPLHLSPNPISESIADQPAGSVYVPTTNTSAIIEPTLVEHTMTVPVGEGNFVTGIRSAVPHLGNCRYQFQFDPPIMKTNEDELVLRFRHSWGRYEP